MNIALLDLNHTTRGIHTNTCPLGIGLIKKYTQTHLIADLDIRLFKEIEKIQSALKTWIPDIIGLALYTWNTELNLFEARRIKKLNPKAIVIVGGPNLPLTSDLKIKFLQEHPEIDLCVEFDGEIPFSTIVGQLVNGSTINDIRINPPAGVYALNPKTNALSDKQEKPPRLASLDDFGSVYADGIFDEFLDAGYHPFVQTHRGCPFSCTFCHTSNAYYNRMMFQSPDIFQKDMEMLAKRFKGRPDVVLYIANTNMSMFNQDFEIAKIIRNMQDKYGWPKFINVNSGKNPDRLLEILKIIKFNPAIALQTLTPEVLRNVHRVNIPIDKYKAFQEEVLRQTGESSETELILCLEGETRESFMKTIRTVINSGVQQIIIFTLMNLRGTPIATPEYAAKNKHTIRHRIVPRQFSDIDGEKIFDTEEVIVATKDMSFDDYLYLRGVSYTIATIFGNSELIPLKRLLLDNNIDLAQWIFNIHERIPKHPELNRHYQEFQTETRDELFETREKLIEYYKNPIHYQELLEGKRGDNLIRKYKANTLREDFSSVLKIALDEARVLLHAKLNAMTADAMLNDMRTYLEFRNMRSVILERKRPDDHIIRLRYNIPLWLSDDGGSILLNDLKGDYTYRVTYKQNIIGLLNNFLGANKDAKLSLDILFRDGSIFVFWPEWQAVETKQI